MSEPLALEVIATSLDDALAAQEGGAARIELVAALERGGLTPPVALVDAVLARVGIPVRVMVRHAESHEVPDPSVRRLLVEGAREIGQRPVHGLVFGALAAGRIDEALLDAVGGASGRPITFHRAFESLLDPDGAIVELRRHPAVDRVLCDGGAGDWPAKVARLREWSRRGAPALQILPGGGVTEDALPVLSNEPALREVHVGRLVREPQTVDGAVSSQRVAALVAQLRRLRATD